MRLGDTGRCLRDVQILCEGQGDEARQGRIIEGGPPGLEVSLALSLPALDTVLTEETSREGRLRRPVVRAKRAASQADTHQNRKKARGSDHDPSFQRPELLM